MFEREYRDLIHVPRWAIARTTRVQSVAEHSFFVALYTSEILSWYSIYHQSQLNPLSYARILRYALKHDRSEAFMSDIPGPVKRSIRDTEKAKDFEDKMDRAVYGHGMDVTDMDKTIIKCADLMDEYGFWWDEQQMGNKFSEKIMPQVYKRLRQAVDNLPYLSPDQKIGLMREFLSGVHKDKHIPENNNDVAS